MSGWGISARSTPCVLWPAVRGARLSKLIWLLFTSMVHDYAERFNEVLCHGHNLSRVPKGGVLCVGGLSDHINVDVELRDPQDVQPAMHLARAFEHRAAASGVAPSARVRSGPPCSTPGAPLTGMAGATSSTPPTHQFLRLTPTKQMEHRHQGLCYTYGEPYVRGHVCQ